MSNNHFCCSGIGDVTLHLNNTFNWSHGLQVNSHNKRRITIPGIG
uniref:Putative tRNA methyltransferase n=1 Tax=Rhizophora mucronata TaxID=61149 RepID=A0A2P2KBM4_RHIMU